MLQTAGSAITGAVQGAPPALRAELSDEAMVIDPMIEESQHGGAARASKFLSADAARKSRKRGRRDNPA